jgi:hypothetical protein
MERINGTDMGIKYRTDGNKMRLFNDATYVVVLIIHNISYTAISIKDVTETIIKCGIWALKG